MASDRKSDYRRVCKALEQTLASFLAQLPDLQGAEEVIGFDDESFWSDLGRIADQLSFEANKLSLAWVQPPPPPASDLAAMGRGLEAAAIQLVAARHALPRAQGRLVASALAAAVRDAVEAAAAFARTLGETIGRRFPGDSHPLLQSFGKVSERCEAVKALPRSNKEAVERALGDQREVLQDALGELEEARAGGFMDIMMEEEDEGPAEQWKDEDQLLINPSVGLIKTAVVLVRKTLATVKVAGGGEAEHCAEYDGLAEVAARLSPAVDDLALALYPPLDWPEGKAAAGVLKAELEVVLLHLGRLHFMAGPEGAWRDFVARAVTHNFSEIQRVFVTRGLAEIRVSGES